MNVVKLTGNLTCWVKPREMVGCVTSCVTPDLNNPAGLPFHHFATPTRGLHNKRPCNQMDNPPCGHPYRSSGATRHQITQLSDRRI